MAAQFRLLASNGATEIMDEKASLQCDDCGEALTAFLQEMADHNAKVTACPKCGKQHLFKPPKPPKTAKPVPKARTDNRTVKII
jgi:DNA-directed RNA polymerase subunit RPC12/RpoP